MKLKDSMTITLDDVEWEMDWTKSKANSSASDRIMAKPDIEIVFEVEQALAWLIADGKIFLNSHWWEEEWTKEQKQLTSINLNCNDLFAWGCADAEELMYKDIEQVWSHYKQDTEYGTDVWCIKKRNQMPQKPLYDAIKKAGYWNLDIMGLHPNQ